MIKQFNYIALLMVSLLTSNNIFAETTEEFESRSKLIKFVPISEENRDDVHAILTNSDCFSAPYQARKDDEQLTKFIDKHIATNKQTNLGGWLVKINNNPVGTACFFAGDVAYNAEDAKKNPDKYIEAGGLDKDNNIELQSSKIALNKIFHPFYTEIMNTFISHAFETNELLDTIKFGVQEPHALGLEYAGKKKFPCVSNTKLDNGRTLYVYKINRAFYLANKDALK